MVSLRELGLLKPFCGSDFMAIVRANLRVSYYFALIQLESKSCSLEQRAVQRFVLESIMSENNDSIRDAYRYTDSNDFMEQVRDGMQPVDCLRCCCNGGIQGKEANENIPETADEIAESAPGGLRGRSLDGARSRSRSTGSNLVRGLS